MHTKKICALYSIGSVAIWSELVSCCCRRCCCVFLCVIFAPINLSAELWASYNTLDFRWSGLWLTLIIFYRYFHVFVVQLPDWLFASAFESSYSVVMGSSQTGAYIMYLYTVCIRSCSRSAFLMIRCANSNPEQYHHHHHFLVTITITIQFWSGHRGIFIKIHRFQYQSYHTYEKWNGKKSRDKRVKGKIQHKKHQICVQELDEDDEGGRNKECDTKWCTKHECNQIHTCLSLDETHRSEAMKQRVKNVIEN